MPMQVCSGATLRCSFGLATSLLVVPPTNRVFTGTPDANIFDNKPLVNIMPFGMCISMANPTVLAATAAAGGVPVPMPCVPVTVIGPWKPGSLTVQIGNILALNNISTLNCMWGGIITVIHPGQTTVYIP